MLFRKNKITKTYDKENTKPAIRASICNGEQVAGFLDVRTGEFHEVCLIRNSADLDAFMNEYGIEDKPEKIY